MKKKRTYIWFFWGIAIIMSAAVFLSVRYFPLLLKTHTHAQSVVGLGEYGDIYGGLNTLFTGLAFVGLLVTIFLQHLELKETRDEFEKQTKQFEEQTSILKKQLEGQVSFNNEQLHIAITSQNKEELLKRLDIIRNIQNEVCIDVLFAEFHPSAKWHFYNSETLKGEDAFEKIFHSYTDIIYAINTERELSELEKHQITCEAQAIYCALNKLNAWLYSINDYLRDAPEYFCKTPNTIGTYYRMLFNSMTKYNEAILLINAGTTIPDKYINACIEKEYIGTQNAVLPVHIDPKARAILFKIANLDISIKEARIVWKQYLNESGLQFDLPEYSVRNVS